MVSVPTWNPVAISGASTTLALLAFAYQVRRARFNQSVDLLFKLEAEFFGPAKVKQRVLSAANQQKNSDDFLEMEDILDFFETIAMLTRKGALNLYMVWHTFDYWIENYYAAAGPHIKAKQARDRGVWEDLGWLNAKLQKLLAKKSGPRNISAADTADFLAEEVAES